ncbi:MAG: hypothetical protein WC313_09425 [Candidatus Kapaibacterium sp.]|jgi:hypothetical protein|nr:hypothetical protein [Candidatus Kapabacteria bacterium]
MKEVKIFILVFMLAAVAIVASSSIIQNFTAESNGDSVTVRWTSSTEENIKRFELERRTANMSAFKRIHTQTSKGTPNQYSYVDNEAFMKQDNNNDVDILSQKTYNYRLKIVFHDNTFTYSDIAMIQHKPSSIRRTWGMIKEMFR